MPVVIAPEWSIGIGAGAERQVSCKVPDIDWTRSGGSAQRCGLANSWRPWGCWVRTPPADPSGTSRMTIFRRHWSGSRRICRDEPTRNPGLHLATRPFVLFRLEDQPAGPIGHVDDQGRDQDDQKQEAEQRNDRPARSRGG